MIPITNKLIIYTDGATSNNGSQDAVGGWSCVILDGDEGLVCTKSGHVKNTTNNICELMAVYNACKFSQECDLPCVIYSDSSYCINCYKQKWYKKWQANGWKNARKEPVANKDLWEKLIPFFENTNFLFEKVAGHANNKWNNLADKLAVQAKAGDNIW